jgi:AcrR family transcriptional regulator
MRATKTKTELRQDQIVQAALKIIARQGFQHLSIAAVADEVGVVPSAIYRHYGSKEEVLDAALEQVSARLLGNVAGARRDGSNALDRLRSLLLRHVELVQNEVPVPRVVFSEAIFTGQKLRRRRVLQVFEDYLAQIARLIEEGQRAGEIRPELCSRTLAMMFLGLVQPPAILWLMSEGEYRFAEQVKSAWAVFRAMLVPAGTPPAIGFRN